MRWRYAVTSLALAGCLDAPPSSTGGPDPDDPDASPPASTLMLNGLASRDALSLDGRDELVLVGRQEGAPVALILSPTGAGLEEVTVTPVDLDFEPVDLIVSRWGALTGLAIAVSDDGALVAIDKNGARVDLVVLEEGAAPAAQRVSDINSSGRRLIFSDGEDLLVSEPIGSGQPGDEPLPLSNLGPSPGAIDVAGAAVTAEGQAIGVLDMDGDVHVYPFIEGDQPTLASDRSSGERAPPGLLRPLWRLVGLQMILVGIDPAVPELWYLTAALAEVDVDSGTVLDDFDAIHDLVMTRLDEQLTELILLVEVGGELAVVVYLDPGSAPEDLPTALTIPVEGLSPPYWMQAMDPVLDDGIAGQNEIIVYDQAGRLACIDLVGGELVSCGTMDLAAALMESGASTSGRPGW